MQGTPDTSAPVDLTSCDREPIQFLNSVQSFGCLIALSSDWNIAQVSSNCSEILGLDATDILGTPIADHIPAEVMHKLRTRLQYLAYDGGAERLNALDVFEDERLFDVAMHRSGQMLVLEFQPVELSRDSAQKPEIVQPLLKRLRRKGDLESFLQEATVAMNMLTGFDRVMVYRFEPDDTGVVVAETRKRGLEPYRGLRYPASDIPKQARALYERATFRLIADVDDKSATIVPTALPNGDSLDLSLAVTRAVSPIHLEYLRNMGVKASMSVSILRRGKLWGLFACHHGTPLLLDQITRSAVELFVQFFSYELANLETEQEIADAGRVRQLHDRLMVRASSGASLHEVFEALRGEINEVIPFDGMAVLSQGEYRASGAAPTEEEFDGLARFLNTAHANSVLALDQISVAHDRAEQFADRCVGLLAIPISRRPRDYVVLFRREIAQSVTWAGNPEKPAALGPNGARLTPRKSFKAWQEIVRGKCAPWQTREMRAAETLRLSLLEAVLKLTDQASAAQQNAQERQELLIAELNHRVRNILNLIRGLVSQGREDEDTVEAYAQVLDDRIYALARAHDQLTQTAWSWVSFQGLVETELKAFLAQGAQRVSVKGDRIELSPTAFSTMALVVHELVTNSAKYGALMDSNGSVEIVVQRREDGTAQIDWIEQNGPPVSPPARRGFGTTIIERSVPFELGGTAEVRFRTTGLEVCFTIPGIHARLQPRVPPKPASRQEALEDFSLAGEAVLLVEDNMIIAMEAHDTFRGLGAETIHVASSVAAALAILKETKVDLAVLDVNLTTETSLSIAKQCRQDGVPFLLTTGYGGGEGVLAQFPKAPICVKPYTVDQLKAALWQLRSSDPA